MARMIAEAYDALKSAGADEDKARAAATAIAGQWDIEPRFDQMDRRFDQIEKHIDKIEERLGRLEERFDRLEQRVSKLEADVGIIMLDARLHPRLSGRDVVLRLATHAAIADLSRS